MYSRGMYHIEYLEKLLNETFDGLVELDPVRCEILKDSYRYSLPEIQRYLNTEGNTVSAKRYFRDLVPVLVRTTRVERNFGITTPPAFKEKTDYMR